MALKNHFTILCDDIRQEQGNKISLMGVYTDVLLLRELPHAMRLGLYQRWSGLPKNGRMQVGIKGPGLTFPILSVEFEQAIKPSFLPQESGDFADFSVVFNQLQFLSEGEHKIICFFGENEHNPEFVQKFYIKKVT